MVLLLVCYMENWSSYSSNMAAHVQLNYACSNFTTGKLFSSRCKKARKCPFSAMKANELEVREEAEHQVIFYRIYFDDVAGIVILNLQNKLMYVVV